MHPAKLNSHCSDEIEESSQCHGTNFAIEGPTLLAPLRYWRPLHFDVTTPVDDCAQQKVSSYSIASKSTTASENADLDEESFSNPPGDVAPSEMEIRERNFRLKCLE